MYLQTLDTEVPNEATGGSTENVIAQIQAEYVVGVAALTGDLESVASAAAILDTGSIEQRQRFMALMIAMNNSDAAMEAELHLTADLLQAERSLNETQTAIQEGLNILASGGSVSEEQRALLLENLGWFGTFLVSNSEAREGVIQESEQKVVTVGILFGIVCFFGVVGCIGLLISLVQIIYSSVQSSMGDSNSNHGIYAEVFAIWLVAFLFLTTAAGVLSFVVSDGNLVVGMMCTITAFFVSLVVLGWAKIRGVSWEEMCRDIGWTRGKGLFREFTIGVYGYAMTLPILVVGILMTLGLALLQTEHLAQSDPFAGAEGAHPIIVDVAHGGFEVRVFLFLLAAVAAPIIEETMFRGVLYRQLRSSTQKFGLLFSIITSVLITSFLFAAIHPQGWIAIPALMSIAIGMNLMREWRGTIIPSMIVHGMSNGIVISILFIFLS